MRVVKQVQVSHGRPVRHFRDSWTCLRVERPDWRWVRDNMYAYLLSVRCPDTLEVRDVQIGRESKQQIQENKYNLIR